ncbi:MAG TPA: tRNA dihydrouridine synthase DusB [bacterium]|nr:tRNA dihydrouridine synthase DusB [bacterium]
MNNDLQTVAQAGRAPAVPLPGVLKIGNLVFEPPVVLAPMAGITSWPVRMLCRRMGAPLAFTEMVSAAAIARGKARGDTLNALKTAPADRPLGIQLFGHDPEEMAQAARILSSLEADIIDVNMGCPVKKVVKRGGGAALMQDLARAGEMVRKTRGAVKVPLTVKMRLGWDHASKNAAELARICEGEGADAVTVHGRTRAQGFAGEVDLEGIRAVVQAVKIPVIGNGGILRPEDAARMMDETGCAGVMVARGMRGGPWIFRALSGRGSGRPSMTERAEAVGRLFSWMLDLMPEKRAVVEMRKHLAWYSKGLPRAADLRRELHTLSTAAEIREMVGKYFAE